MRCKVVIHWPPLSYSTPCLCCPERECSINYWDNGPVSGLTFLFCVCVFCFIACFYLFLYLLLDILYLKQLLSSDCCSFVLTLSSLIVGRLITQRGSNRSEFTCNTLSSSPILLVHKSHTFSNHQSIMNFIFKNYNH